MLIIVSRDNASNVVEEIERGGCYKLCQEIDGYKNDNVGLMFCKVEENKMDVDCEKVIEDNDRIKYVDIFKKITGKDYRICYEEEKGHEQWITGLLINYNSGNIDLYDYKKEAIYHIPYPNIRWIIPIKLKSYIMK